MDLFNMLEDVEHSGVTSYDPWEKVRGCAVLIARAPDDAKLIQMLVEHLVERNEQAQKEIVSSTPVVRTLEETSEEDTKVVRWHWVETDSVNEARYIQSLPSYKTKKGAIEASSDWKEAGTKLCTVGLNALGYVVRGTIEEFEVTAKDEEELEDS